MKKWDVVKYYYSVGGEKQEIVEKLGEGEIGAYVEKEFIVIDGGGICIEDIKCLRIEIDNCLERNGYTFVLYKIKKSKEKVKKFL